eukprot:4781928-Prymnesium_polylepis.2
MRFRFCEVPLPILSLAFPPHSHSSAAVTDTDQQMWKVLAPTAATIDLTRRPLLSVHGCAPPLSVHGCAPRQTICSM